jgi:hypothetical protein
MRILVFAVILNCYLLAVSAGKDEKAKDWWETTVVSFNLEKIIKIYTLLLSFTTISSIKFILGVLWTRMAMELVI